VLWLAQLGRAGCKQVKGELDWADFQVRSDRAIRRHWALVACAFSFCWQTWLANHLSNRSRPIPSPHPRPRGGRSRPVIGAEPAVRLSWPVALRAVRAWLTPWIVLQHLLAVVVASAPAAAAPRAA
jgi:hypothetical protein